MNKIPVMYGLQYSSTVAERVEYKVNLFHDEIKFNLLRCNVFLHYQNAEESRIRKPLLFYLKLWEN